MHVNASPSVFGYHWRGVINSKLCTPKINHVVQAIGFGVDPKTGREYFIIKNSWGKLWGKWGYGKIDAGTDIFP